MKIGDEVYIHGYVDEIRQNVVIIRNDGGYFGTVAEEITSRSEIPDTCGDAISRADARHLIAETNRKSLGYISTKVFKILYDGIDKLPSVTPQPKTGQWIEDAKTYYEELNKRGLGVDEYTPYFTDDIACSECLAKYSMLDNETQFFKYCPNCGAKMEVEDAD